MASTASSGPYWSHTICCGKNLGGGVVSKTRPVSDTFVGNLVVSCILRRAPFGQVAFSSICSHIIACGIISKADLTLVMQLGSDQAVEEMVLFCGNLEAEIEDLDAVTKGQETSVGKLLQERLRGVSERIRDVLGLPVAEATIDTLGLEVARGRLRDTTSVLKDVEDIRARILSDRFQASVAAALQCDGSVRICRDAPGCACSGQLRSADTKFSTTEQAKKKRKSYGAGSSLDAQAVVEQSMDPMMNVDGVDDPIALASRESLSAKLIMLIQQIKEEEPQEFPTILTELLDSPTPAMISAVALRVRAELQALMLDPLLANKDLILFLDSKGTYKLEVAIDEMLVKAHTKCPYLFGILVAVQLSKNDLTEMRQHFPPTALEDLTRGTLIDPSQQSQRLTLERKVHDLRSMPSLSRTNEQELRELEASLQEVTRKSNRTKAYGMKYSFNALRWISEFIHVSRTDLFLPMMYMMGLLFKVGGLSAKGFDILSKLSITYARTTITVALYALLTALAKQLEQTVRTQRADQRILPMVHGDNFNVQKWDGVMLPGGTFTKSVDSFTLMSRAFKMPTWFNTAVTSKTPPMPDITDESIDAVLPLLSQREWGMCAVIKTRDTTDVSLTKFTAWPSISAKSSSKFDMITAFFGGVCYEELGLKTKPGIVSVDPEPALRLLENIVLLGGPAGPFRNIIPPPAPFHAEGHLMQEMFKDVSAFLLVICPFLRWMRYRPKAYDTLMTKLIKLLVVSVAKPQGAGGSAAGMATSIRKELEAFVDDEEQAEEEVEGAGTRPPEGGPPQVAGGGRKRKTSAPHKLVDVELVTLFSTLAKFMAIDMQAKAEKCTVPVEEVLTDDQKEDRKIEKARRKAEKAAAAKRKEEEINGEETVTTATTRFKKAPAVKPPKVPSFSNAQFIALKKLKHFMDGLFMCYKMNKAELKRQYADEQNPLVDYAFSVFDDQLELAVAPFHELVQKGNVGPFYDALPTIICYLGYNDHPHLVKAYMFHLLCLQRWKGKREDILLLLGSVCKSGNDVYIEHHHSVMARLLRRLFPGPIHFEYIRIVSMLALFCRLLFGYFLQKTFTAPSPTSLDAEIEDMPANPTFYDAFMSTLRRRKQRGLSTTVHASEPERQMLVWENNDDAKVDISKYLFDYFKELSKLEVRKCRAGEIESMNRYRPLQLSRRHTDYYVYLMKNYAANARNDDAKAAAQFVKSDLRVFLESGTLKDTNKPLIERLANRVRLSKIVIRQPIPSFAKSGKKADVVERIEKAIQQIGVGHAGSHAVLAPALQLKKVMEICDGDSADEPSIYYDTTKDFTSRDWDRQRLWQYTTQEFIPIFLKDVLWKPVKGVTKVLDPEP